MYEENFIYILENINIRMIAIKKKRGLKEYLGFEQVIEIGKGVS